MEWNWLNGIWKEILEFSIPNCGKSIPKLSKFEYSALFIGSVYQFHDFSVPLPGFRSVPDFSSITSSNDFFVFNSITSSSPVNQFHSKFQLIFFVFSSIPSSSPEYQLHSKFQSSKELKKYLKLELEPDIRSIPRFKNLVNVPGLPDPFQKN